MFNIRKRIVTDEENRPVEVLIDYEDWCRVEEALKLHDKDARPIDPSRHAGKLKWGEDAVAYQRRVREEWGR
ncbi:MAG: hypothetical protein HOP29_01830 [Phycisphaerales bacterium]|nr:hypothetical protein [Phycisphaerales bacterium]